MNTQEKWDGAEDDTWSELIGSYHEEGGVIGVSGPSGGVQTLGWDSTHMTTAPHTHIHTQQDEMMDREEVIVQI